MELDIIIEKIKEFFLNIANLLFVLCSAYVLIDATFFIMYKTAPDKTSNFTGGEMNNPSKPLAHGFSELFHSKPILTFCIIVIIVWLSLYIYRKQR